MPHDSSSFVGTETPTPDTSDRVFLKHEIARGGEADGANSGVKLPDQPEVPPWLNEFITFYRERFGEVLVLPGRAAPSPTNGKITDESTAISDLASPDPAGNPADWNIAKNRILFSPEEAPNDECTSTESDNIAKRSLRKILLALFLLLAFVALTLILLKPHPAKTTRGHRVARSPAVIQASNVAQIQDTAPVTIAGIQHSSTLKSTIVVVQLSGNVRYTVNRASRPARIYIDFSDSRPGAHLDGRAFRVAAPCLHRYRVAAHNQEQTRLTFETGQLCDYFTRVTLNRYRLVVGLQPHHANR